MAHHLTTQEAPLYHCAWLDKDSHADIHCAGASFTLLSTSGYTCDVDSFLNTYATTTNIPMVKAATAINLHTSETYFLVMMGALWFGANMKTSLFNQNLEHDARLQICTDPHDPNHAFGISDPSRGLFIPLEQRGAVVGLEIYKPDRDTVLEALWTSPHQIIYLNQTADFTLTPQIKSIYDIVAKQ